MSLKFLGINSGRTGSLVREHKCPEIGQGDTGPQPPINDDYYVPSRISTMSGQYLWLFTHFSLDRTPDQVD